MNAEIQQADPVLRRRVLAAALAAAALGVAGVLALDAYLGSLEELAENALPMAAERALGAARLFFGLLAAGSAALGVVLGRLSWRTLASARFPPPGARVIGDTRIERGRRARLYGWGGLALAFLIVVLGLAVCWQSYQVLEQLLDVRLKPTRL